MKPGRCKICKQPAVRKRGLASLCASIDCEVSLGKPEPVKRKAPKKRTTASEKRHMSSVAELGCIVCRNLGYGYTPCELHHPRELAGGGQKSSNDDVIGLCPNHHRLGGYGVAYHAGPKIWEEKFGTEIELLTQTKKLMGKE